MPNTVKDRPWPQTSHWWKYYEYHWYQPLNPWCVVFCLWLLYWMYWHPHRCHSDLNTCSLTSLKKCSMIVVCFLWRHFVNSTALLTLHQFVHSGFVWFLAGWGCSVSLCGSGVLCLIWTQSSLYSVWFLESLLPHGNAISGELKECSRWNKKGW